MRLLLPSLCAKWHGAATLPGSVRRLVHSLRVFTVLYLNLSSVQFHRLITIICFCDTVCVCLIHVFVDIIISVFLSMDFLLFHLLLSPFIHLSPFLYMSVFICLSLYYMSLYRTFSLSQMLRICNFLDRISVYPVSFSLFHPPLTLYAYIYRPNEQTTYPSNHPPPIYLFT